MRRLRGGGEVLLLRQMINTNLIQVLQCSSSLSTLFFNFCLQFPPLHLNAILNLSNHLVSSLSLPSMFFISSPIQFISIFTQPPCHNSTNMHQTSHIIYYQGLLQYSHIFLETLTWLMWKGWSGTGIKNLKKNEMI